MEKRIGRITAAFVILVVALVSVAGCSSGSGTPVPTPGAQVKSSALNIVSAEGNVVPAQHTTLAFKTSGRIVEVPVHEGDAVKAGAVLAHLDDTTMQKQLAQAKVQLATAQAQLAQADAQVQLAEKQLAQVKVGGTEADIAAAQAALKSAQASYDKVRQGPTANELGSLKANLDNAKAALDQAQFAYDRAGGPSNPYIQLTPESLQLQQATNAYNAALATYNDARSHPTASDLAAAEAQIQQAQNTLARLNPTQQALDVAQAQVAAAQAARGVAQTQVNSAQAALDLANAQAADYVLTAPFDGSIVESTAEVGQVVSPGAPAFTFADLSKLQIETVDLAEVDVAKVAVGQNVSIKLDAFEGQAFTGKVVRVAQSANDHRGDKVFKVTLDVPDAVGAGLRWGMTANVEIAVANK